MEPIISTNMSAISGNLFNHYIYWTYIEYRTRYNLHWICQNLIFWFYCLVTYELLTWNKNAASEVGIPNLLTYSRPVSHLVVQLYFVQHPFLRSSPWQRTLMRNGVFFMVQHCFWWKITKLFTVKYKLFYKYSQK